MRMWATAAASSALAAPWFDGSDALELLEVGNQVGGPCAQLPSKDGAAAALQQQQLIKGLQQQQQAWVVRQSTDARAERLGRCRH